MLQGYTPCHVFDVGIESSILMDYNHTGKFSVSLRPDQTGPNLACCTGVFHVLRYQAHIILWYDLGSGRTSFQQRQERIGSGGASGDDSEFLEEFTSIQ
jgi:hypothetical protein